ncbi:hypothetical protein [Filimonas effusa]|uniref:Uncharacterized protein n=1 Tax=Filimonas effusa TaxID=2508721 RepID=A0A4V1MAF3_9BACT|nr:hypothetical protein [Filimonas effusa]RXK85676.1 hypothetical protein ESB13_02350 [Filimonas effusa]
MNYLQLYEALTGLLPKRIKITLINYNTGQEIGIFKIDASNLPEVFDKPLVIDIGNKRWRVMQAAPKTAADYLFSKKLILKVQDELLPANLLPFQAPTTAADKPAILPREPVDAVAKIAFDSKSVFAGASYNAAIPSVTGEIAKGGSQSPDPYILTIEETDWRQVELAAEDCLSVVTIDLHSVQQLLSEQPDALTGYRQQHTRSRQLTQTLLIPWNSFLDQLHKPVIGPLYLRRSGWVENGFTIASEHHTYYGISTNDHIRVLCLPAMPVMDDELMNIMEHFKLLLVDWCGAYCFGGITNPFEPQNNVK